MLRRNSRLSHESDMMLAQQIGAVMADAAQNVLMHLLRPKPALAQWSEMD